MIAAFAVVCLFTSAPSKAQAQGEGSFLMACEARWQRDVPIIGAGIAEAECEMDWYVFYSEPDCTLECQYYSYFPAQVEEPGNQYEGSEGGTCLTCAGWKPD